MCDKALHNIGDVPNSHARYNMQKQKLFQLWKQKIMPVAVKLFLH